MLCNRYNNNRILLQHHVKAIFSIERVHDESSGAIRKVIDNVAKHLRALKKLNQPTESWDTLLIHIITTKLDFATAREWEEKRGYLSNPTLNDLNEFLKNRADLLESLEHNNKSSRKRMHQGKEQRINSFLSSRGRCSYCKGDHFIQGCKRFVDLSVQERIEVAKSHKL